MSVPDAGRDVVENLFKAMQMGRDGVDLIMSLFAPDATFSESFSGEVRVHKGHDAIRDAFLASADNPPDMELSVQKIEMDGDVIVATWECTSEVFPAPMRGIDRFQLEDGAIKVLEVILEGPPGE